MCTTQQARHVRQALGAYEKVVRVAGELCRNKEFPVTIDFNRASGSLVTT